MSIQQDCVFCKIVAKKIPSEIVYEDEDILAFKDIDPKAPVHILIVPKEHIPTLNDSKNFNIFSKIFEVVVKLAKENKIDYDGYRVMVNCNKAAGQLIFHLHFHLLGGKFMPWP